VSKATKCHCASTVQSQGGRVGNVIPNITNDINLLHQNTNHQYTYTSAVCKSTCANQASAAIKHKPHLCTMLLKHN